MRLLDLFCGAGGAAMGYSQAGFDVVGVDINRQPNYPFGYFKADALRWNDFDGIDLIHASPPCQAYSDLAHRTGRAYPDLISATRDLLLKSGIPYVIENVEGAPLHNPARLCGTMFPGLRVIRHRLFESSFLVLTPPHPKHPLVFTHDRRKAHHGQLDQDRAFVQVTGGGNSTVRNASEAMGIGWMSKAELNEAIPPAYTEYLGRQFLDQL